MKEIKYKPRIAVDARPLAYGLTGNSRYLFEVLKILLIENSYFEYVFYSNKNIHSNFLPFLNEKKVKLNIKPLNGFFWLNFYLPFQLKKDRVDLFWGTLQLLPFLPYSIPSVVNYHDLNFVSAPETMSKTNYIQHKLFSPITISKADQIFCLSENTRKEISNFNPSSSKKLKLVYPGVNKKPNPKTDFKIDGDYILTVGTLEPRKNLQTIVSAFLEIKKENPQFSLKLVLASRVGIGWGQEELTEKLRNSEEYKSLGIILVENPSDEVLEKLYKDSTFFVFPSIHEGFGLPLLEALVEQKICIASDIAVFKEVLHPDIDFLVPSLDIQAWKTAILNLAKQKNWKRKILWDEKKWTWLEAAKKIEESILLLWHKRLEKSHAI